MRITYITHTRFPTEKAHGNQVAQVCHALAQLGHEVTLVAPTVGSIMTQNPWEYYGLPRSFEMVYPGSFDALNSKFVPGKLSFAVSMWSYRRALRKYLKENPADLLYVRSPSLLEPLLKTRTPVLLELHAIPRLFRRGFARMCNRCFRVVCLTSLMRSALLAMGVDPVRIAVEADGVDLERFELLRTPDAAKAQWNLPAVPVIGYIGSLATQNIIEKGVGELIGALAHLKAQGERVFGFVVGGPVSWRQIYEEKARSLGLTAEDVRFLDRVPPLEVPSVIAAFDVCVYPAPASTHSYFLRDTSPLKLFEYLASGKPVVCADLPPLRDVVSEDSVRFCTPGNPESLANAIHWVLEHPEDAREMAHTGKEIAEEHSWVERMKRVIGG